MSATPTSAASLEIIIPPAGVKVIPSGCLNNDFIYSINIPELSIYICYNNQFIYG